jgi:hypothetical protein
MKVRVAISDTTYFYYHRLRTGGIGTSWCERPSVLFEIILEGTRATDEREKAARLNQFTLPSLDAYVRIEQDRRELVIEHRSPEGWRREVLDAAGVVKLPTVEVEFALAELYDRLELP